MKYRFEFIKKKDDVLGRPVKFENCFHTLRPFITETGLYYTGLKTDTEIAEFAKKLGLSKEELKAPYYSSQPDPLSKEGRFWSTFKVQVGIKGITLDTTKPLEELTYYFLKGYPKVAKSLEEANASHIFLLKNEEEDAIRKNVDAKKKRKAYAEMEKMSIDEMRQCLRIMGIKTMTLSNQRIESEMNEVCEKESEKFFSLWVENKQREWHDLVYKCLEYGIMRKERTVYYYNTDIVGASFDATVAYLQNPKNKDLKASLETQLDAKMKV